MNSIANNRFVTFMLSYNRSMKPFQHAPQRWFSLLFAFLTGVALTCVLFLSLLPSRYVLTNNIETVKERNVHSVLKHIVQSVNPVYSQPHQLNELSIGMVAVADTSHLHQYSTHFQSFKCYAHRWNNTLIDIVSNELVKDTNASDKSIKQYVEFIAFDPSIDSCSHHENFFFRKHCAVAHLMEARERDRLEMQRDDEKPSYDWIVVLDGDSFVVNADNSLSKHLPIDRSADRSIDPTINIVFYERFHNGEITAGNYLIRNQRHSQPISMTSSLTTYTPDNQPVNLLNNHSIIASTKQFLLDWANMEWRVPKDAYHNHDNGALHMFILEKLYAYQQSNKQSIKQSNDPLITAESLDVCRSIWAAASDVPSYDRFIGCVKCVLGGRRSFPEIGVEIRRRGQFFVRDFFVSSVGDGPRVDNVGLVGKDDLFYHGWKDSPVGVWWQDNVTPESCGLGDNKSTDQSNVAPWTPKLIPRVIADDAKLASMVRERGRYSANDRPASLGIDDVKDCWPHCPANLSNEQEIELRQKVCPEQLRSYFGL